MPAPAIALRSLGSLSLSAASGLVADPGGIWVVGDDLAALHRYSLAGRPERVLLLQPGGGLPQPKKLKLDLEALARLPDGRLLVLPSGSKNRRQRGFVVDVRRAEVRGVDFEPLYAELRRSFQALNLEGAAVVGNRLLLAQRGNSEHLENALVALDLDLALAELGAGALSARGLRALWPVRLGDLAQVPLTLTDLGLDGQGRLHFSAAAERTKDPYLDGGCAGSVIGRLGREGAVEWVSPLPGPPLKIEGLHWLDADASAARWLLVADADDVTVPAPLIEARIASF